MLIQETKMQLGQKLDLEGPQTEEHAAGKMFLCLHMQSFVTIHL